MMFPHYDAVYWLLTIPAILLALGASVVTQWTFRRYSRVASSTRITGAQAAHRLLRFSGVQDVKIEQVHSFLGDHYDPSAKVLRLSPGVYDNPSLAAIGVACHEAGHAIQHAERYAPLVLRTLLVPVAQIGSRFSYWILFAGFGLMSLGSRMGMLVIWAGLGLMAASVVFSLVTLPVEWDASARARKQMVACGVVTPMEADDAGRVLNAAFLTYVAAAVSGILTLLYYLLRSGLLGGSRRDD
jgi:Zn-dependent membrane protease YugP